MKHPPKNCKDYLVTGELFDLEKDKELEGVLQTYPHPSEEKIYAYYESEEYVSHADKPKNLFEKLYQIVKNYNISYKINLIKKHSSGKKILDYGCGTGSFLEQIQKHGFTPYGYEPVEKAALLAKEKIGSKNVFGPQHEIENIPNKVDIISLWHVLEHIIPLHEKTRELINLLEADGKLIIAVPNYESWDAKYYKEHWAAYDVPRHIWHFSPEGVKNFAEKHGMKIVKRYPLWFDSFYVSMLSEKYKGSVSGKLKGVIIGFISNLKAMQTKNFSSIVYVLERKSA